MESNFVSVLTFTISYKALKILGSLNYYDQIPGRKNGTFQGAF